MRRLRNLIIPVSVFAGLIEPLQGAEKKCQQSGVIVDATRIEDAEKVCEAVEAAQPLFNNCNLPGTPPGLRIDVVEDLQQSCVAVYHCGEKWIEILAPGAMQERRLPGSAFAALDIENYFRSVVIHELAHVMLDDMDCPFEACVAASEYGAYVLQVMSLSPEQQKAFEERAKLNRKISRDELNAMYLFLAPNKFAQKAWAHASQRDDPCGFLGQVVDGTVLLDREHL